jgi:hypothetical protein
MKENGKIDGEVAGFGFGEVLPEALIQESRGGWLELSL